MQHQTARMESLIEDLLLLSHLENQEEKKVEHKKANKIDIAKLLLAISEEAKALSSGKHIFEFNFNKKLNLYGNEKELRSLFSNLIFNAVKYTPTSGKITVEWVEKNKKAYFSVSDT